MKMQRKPQWTSSRLDSLLQELRGNKLDETTKEKPWAVNAFVQEITTVGFCALKTDSRKVHIHFFPPSLMEMRACEIKQLIVETESRRYARQKEKKLNRNTKHFFFHSFENIDGSAFTKNFLLITSGAKVGLKQVKTTEYFHQSLVSKGKTKKINCSSREVLSPNLFVCLFIQLLLSALSLI